VAPEGGVVLGLHKASFVVWLATTGIHVLGHPRRTPRLALANWGGRVAPNDAAVTGASLRRLLVAGVLAAGAILAFAMLHFGRAWLHRASFRRRFDG
jgi:hypothetical protein